MKDSSKKSSGQMSPIILYELNEVPWRVFDWYIQQRPDSNLARLFKVSGCYTTRTYDAGELHPWSTWPTLHRGVYNTVHHILFVNQDKQCASKYPPLWESLRDQGLRVGVFGSMQSWPVPDNGHYCFYIPDTFAQTPETFPEAYSAFQSINLRQTKADGAVTQPVQLNSSVLSDLIKLPFIGVRPVTFIALAKHLLNEKLNPLYRTRRALMQAPLAFDVFLHAFKKTRPDFSTFFTNHVAGAMHRYWKYAFPEDFGETLKTDACHFKRETLLAAMDIADKQIGELKSLIDKDGGQLLLASSMGQEAIDRGFYAGELRLVNPDLLMATIGFTRPYKDMLAMQPDFNFEFESAAAATEFIQKANRLHSVSGECLWKRTRQEGATVNMGMGSPEDSIREGILLLDDEMKPEITRRLQLGELGIAKIERDPGTGYHQPLGCLIWYGNKKYSDTNRTEIESTAVRKMIMDNFLSA
jgi:hypothetical protein